VLADDLKLNWIDRFAAHRASAHFDAPTVVKDSIHDCGLDREGIVAKDVALLPRRHDGLSRVLGRERPQPDRVVEDARDAGL
jgi:hypothetical protein